MQLTGAEIIIECLKEQKVDTVFGYPVEQSLTFMMLSINIVMRFSIF
mgnify:CR=1 FL=1